MEFLGQSCGKCITEEQRIGDGVRDCVHGVDEAPDAVKSGGVVTANVSTQDASAKH